MCTQVQSQPWPVAQPWLQPVQGGPGPSLVTRAIPQKQLGALSETRWVESGRMSYVSALPCVFPSKPAPDSQLWRQI